MRKVTIMVFVALLAIWGAIELTAYQQDKPEKGKSDEAKLEKKQKGQTAKRKKFDQDVVECKSKGKCIGPPKTNKTANGTYEVWCEKDQNCKDPKGPCNCRLYQKNAQETGAIWMYTGKQDGDKAIGVAKSELNSLKCFCVRTRQQGETPPEE